MQKTIERSQLKGSIRIPPSKSHTLRALLFGGLAQGKTRVYHPLHSPDTEAMIHALRAFGVSIEWQQHHLFIEGINGKFGAAEDVIQAGNSGQVLRFIGALAGLSTFPIVLTGDLSIRNNRPVKPLLEGLCQLGAQAFSLRGNGYAPIYIQGPLQGGTAVIDGEDSQPVSGLLIASAFSKGPVTLQVRNPGEKPWVGLTLSWFDRLGIPYHAVDFTHYAMPGNARIDGFQFEVPGDFSSCAFPLVGALLTQSEITLQGLDMEDAQGDKQFVELMIAWGAQLDIDQEKKEIHVKKTPSLKGGVVDGNAFIDAVPILAVAACFAEQETMIHNVSVAKKKECDRLTCIVSELRKMGGHIEETADGLLIRPSRLKGASVEAYNDHRMAMALSVAALAADGQTLVSGTSCVAKSYGNFFESLGYLGARIS